MTLSPNGLLAARADQVMDKAEELRRKARTGTARDHDVDCPRERITGAGNGGIGGRDKSAARARYRHSPGAGQQMAKAGKADRKPITCHSRRNLLLGPARSGLGIVAPGPAEQDPLP